MLNNNKVVVLCSGGLDSLVTSELYRHLGYDVTPLYIDYGNANSEEEWGVFTRYCHKHNLDWYCEVAKISFYKPLIEQKQDYMPMRNLIFLSIGIALAETIGAGLVAIGIIDVGEAYSDCSEEFIQSLNILATNSSDIEVVAPLKYATKDKVVKMAMGFGLDLDEVYTCEHPLPEGVPCGSCIKCTDLQKAKELVQNTK